MNEPDSGTAASAADSSTSKPSFEERNAMLTRKVNYATFNQRMFAAIIDVGAVLLVAYPLGEMLQNVIFPPIDYTYLSVLTSTEITEEDKIRLMLKFMSEQHMWSRMMVTNLFQICLFGLYILPFWMRYQSTPGKMLAGIEIRDAETFGLMTHGQMVRRFLGYIVSGIPLTLGFVWMVFSKRKQSWHDSIAGTIVVIKESKRTSLTLRSASQ